MSLVHEEAEIIGSAIQARRSEQVHTIIAPPETPREIGHGHDLNHRDAQRRQLFEFAFGCTPRSFARKRPDVHFVEDLPLTFHAPPAGIGPGKCIWVDYLRRPMRSLWLETRSRVRPKLASAV